MIFKDFDNAVLYYENAALRTFERYTNLSAEEVGKLIGKGKKTVANNVPRQGNTKDYSIQDVVRWLVDKNKITLGDIIRSRKAA
jgi:hypothetical protein